MLKLDNAAQMRQQYGETQGRTCGECKLYWMCFIDEHYRAGVAAENRKRSSACGKFENKPEAGDGRL